jgi:hypothetical protein
MYDLGAGAELAHGVGHAIVKARTHGEDHIRVVHGHVGFVEAVHAQHAQKLLVRSRIGTQPHQRIGDRITEMPGQLTQQIAAAPEYHATPGVNNRAPGRQQQLCGLANLSAVPAHRRRVGTQLHIIRVHVGEALVGSCNVLGDINHDGPGRPLAAI